MKNQDRRWVQRFQNFQMAYARLLDGAVIADRRPLNDLEQQGLIKGFEFTHELAWNTLKDFLEAQGAKNLFGSRNATREAFARGIIHNGEVWMKMIEHRNQSTHTYSQKMADEVISAIITKYLLEFGKLQTLLQQLEKEEALE